MNVCLVSTYELGRQPFGLASPAAWLRAAGHEVCQQDLSRKPLDEGAIRAAGLVAFHLPMHTATRLAIPVIARTRALNPSARLAAYGLYAATNETLLTSLGVTAILGPESEADLVRLASAGSGGPAAGAPRVASLPRLAFIQPDRRGLPPLDEYATLRMPDGEHRVAGYTEATRGCKHLCRHCPVVPVYGGQFRVVPSDVVLADIRAQVEAGARHITFGDPDFLNGPTHALRIVEHVAREWPGVTYDVVIKVEHILRHRREMERLRETGCLFVTSAVESFDDGVLARLDKGHTRADIEQAADWMRSIGLPLVPTFVAFTPWTTPQAYLGMLDAIDGLGLVEHVAPIQLGIRLLVPEGSRLLELSDLRPILGTFDARALAYPWRHPDARVDRLHRDVLTAVGHHVSASRTVVFEAVRRLARAAAGVPEPMRADGPPFVARAAVPYLDEPWYC
jgi:hypothetical protein